MTIRTQRWLRAAMGLLFLLAAIRSARSGVMLGRSHDVGPRGDLSVYIGALNHLTTGGRLYSWTNGSYGFTYPPFAALLLHPVTWASPEVVGGVWLVISAVLACVVAGLVGWSRPVPAPWRPVVALGAAAVFLPSAQVQSDLITGQVNLLIAVLVLLDLGGLLPPRWRGAGVGLAAAIKLTPLLVIAWFLVTRQWKPLVRSLGVFLGALLVAGVVLPRDSADYWFGAILQVSRVGDVSLRFNASVMGLLAGWGVGGAPLTVLWLLLGTGVVLTAFWHASRTRRHDPVAATVLLMMSTVAASPISWPHHQIWMPLAGVVLGLSRPLTARVAGAFIIVWSVLHIPITRASDQWGQLNWFIDRIDHLIVVGTCLLGLGAARHVRGDARDLMDPPRERGPVDDRQPTTRSR